MTHPSMGTLDTDGGSISKELALVIINYNTREELRSALLSIDRLEPKEELEVLVVDNGSSDGSREMVREEFPQVKLISNDLNRGYAQACNLGMLFTEAPFVMVLNSDVEFLKGHPRDLVRFLKEHPRAGAVGPQLLNSDGTLQFSCRNFPSLAVSLGHAFLGDLFPRNPFTRSYHMIDFDHCEVAEVDWISGAAMMLRRQAFEEAGGFDEGYFMYVEDVDLCWRLKRTGWKVFYCPEVKIVHHIARASSQQSTRMLFQHHRSMYRFYKRKREAEGIPLAGLFILVGIAARFVFVWSLNRLRRISNKGSKQGK